MFQQGLGGFHAVGGGGEDASGIARPLEDPGLFANPDCLLTNSNCYGVTIAEHVVMVLLMLLRRMPEYEEVVRSRGWSNQLPIRGRRYSPGSCSPRRGG